MPMSTVSTLELMKRQAAMNAPDVRRVASVMTLPLRALTLDEALGLVRYRAEIEGGYSVELDLCALMLLKPFAHEGEEVWG